MECLSGSRSAGNVWEWVLDAYENQMYRGGYIDFTLEEIDSEVIAKTKMFGGPQMRASGPDLDPAYFCKKPDCFFFHPKVRRGGCTHSSTRVLRSSYRRWQDPWARRKNTGFRLLRTI